MNEEIVTNSFEETQKLGEKIGSDLKTGAILALFGELGSGKTTFVQGLAKGLGIKRRIISPTFIIVRNYELGIRNQGVKIFYHVDLYRVESEKEVQGLGIEEILNDQNRIIAIEWAEKIKELLPKKRTEIYFENLGENKRRITVVPMI